MMALNSYPKNNQKIMKKSDRTSILKEAIADATELRDLAIETAKMQLAEKFAPRLEKIFSDKMKNEMELSSEDDEINEDEELDVDNGKEVDEIEIDEAEEGTEEHEGAETSEEEAEEHDEDDEDIDVEVEDDDSTEEDVDEEIDLDINIGDFGGDLNEEDDLDIEDEEIPIDEDDEIEFEDEDEPKEIDEDDEIEFEVEDDEPTIDEDDEIEFEDEDESEEEPIKEEDEDVDVEVEDDDSTEDEDESPELEEAMNVIKQLRFEMNEIKLFNYKILKQNDIVNKFKLNESQRNRVVLAFDKAKNTKQVDKLTEKISTVFGGESKKIVEVKKSIDNKQKAKKMGILKENATVTNVRTKKPIIDEDPYASINQRFQDLAFD